MTKLKTKIKLTPTDKDSVIIGKIAERAVKMARKEGNKKWDNIDARLDIIACHLNGNPLQLKRLLEADDFNFSHDVFGINRHLDRTTGKLMNCFSPRSSA